MKKKLLVLALAACVLLTSCKEPEQETIELLEPSISTEETFEATYRTIFTKVMYDGYVVPKVYQLGFSNSGTFGEYKFQMGDSVKKGDVLAVTYAKNYDDKIEEYTKQIETIDRDLEYNLAADDLDLQIQNENISAIYDQRNALLVPMKKDVNLQYQYIALTEAAISAEGTRDMMILKTEQRKETAELQKKQLNDKISKLRTEQSVNTIVAPCDGIISGQMPYLTGDPVSGTKKIMTISDYNELSIKTEYIEDFNIEAAAHIFGVYKGERVALTNVPYTKQEYDYLIAQFETPVSTFVPTDSNFVLEQGTYVPVCVSRTYIENVLAVPIKAVVEGDDGKSYVMVQTDYGKEKREVIAGEKDLYYQEIASGLKEGDVVYVSE